MAQEVLESKESLKKHCMWNQNDPFIQSHTHSNFTILDVTKMFPNGPNNKPALHGCMWLWKKSGREILEKGKKKKGNWGSIPFHLGIKAKTIHRTTSMTMVMS